MKLRKAAAARYSSFDLPARTHSDAPPTSEFTRLVPSRTGSIATDHFISGLAVLPTVPWSATEDIIIWHSPEAKAWVMVGPVSGILILKRPSSRFFFMYFM